MNRFRVRLISASALQTDKARRFRGGDYSVHVADTYRTKPNGETIHDGLRFTVEISSQNIHDAIKTARGLASQIADDLSLAHGCAIEEPEPLFALSLDPIDDHLELGQVIRNVPELRRFRRPFNDEIMRPISELLEKARLSDSHNNLIPRLNRALRYLRRGSLETDPIDRFEDLSNALQSLEPRLRERYHTPTKFSRACPSCREALICKCCEGAILDEDRLSGVDHLITNILKQSPMDARALRVKRNEIVHSTKDFNSISVGLTELTDLAQVAVVAGVLELLEADSALHAKLNRKNLPIFRTPELVVVVALHGASQQAIEQQKQYPAVKLKWITSLRPNRDLKATDPYDISTLIVHIDVEDYAGEWSPIQALLGVNRDPEDTSPRPQVMIKEERSQRTRPSG